MVQLLFLIFILIIPVFGKALNYTESIFFYGFSSLFFIYFLSKNKDFHLKTKNIVILTILIILNLISTICSKNIGLSYYQFFAYLNITLLSLFAIKFIEPKKMETGLIIFSLLYCFIFLANKIGLLSFAGKNISGDNFFVQVYGHSYLANILVFSIPILFDFLSREKNRKKIYLLITSLSIIFISLILTNSRSALLSLAIGLFFLKTEKPSLKLIKKILASLLILITIFASFFIFKNKIKSKTLLGDREKYFQNALVGFSKSPLFGNGPSSFYFVNQKYKPNSTINTSLSHSSIGNFLSENGIIFTLLFFTLVFFALKKNYKSNNLFFVCSLISIIFSLLDLIWDFPGIFVISLYFIFFESLQNQNNENQKKSKNFISLLSAILFLFFVSKTISDIFFLKGKFQTSLFFDPFNLNSRIAIIKKENPDSAIWQKNLKFSLVFFKNNDTLYQALIDTLPFPKNENYYFGLFELNPKGNNKNYLNLIDLYKKNNLKDKLEKLLYFIAKNSVTNQFARPEQIIIEKTLYHSAIENFSGNPQKTIDFLRQCLKYENDLSHFHIEIANSYWHSGEKNKAIDQLNACIKIETSSRHCQWYLENFRNQFLYPGEKQFSDYIDNQLN